MASIQFRTVDVEWDADFLSRDRQAGAPALLLLHGFPTSSHMFRDLIPLLADRFHLVAPDLPGFGRSDIPSGISFAKDCGHHWPVYRGYRIEPVRNLHLRLWCAYGTSPRPEVPRTRHGDHHAERQRL